jgi:hypothetical protein
MARCIGVALTAMLGARATGSVRGVAVVALGVAVRRLGVSTGLRAMDPHHSRRSGALTMISRHALRTL